MSRDESQPLKMAREVVAAGSWLYGPGEAEDICAEFVAIVDAAQLATALTERDEARSRLAKAREEIEGLAAQLAAALKDLHATTPGEVIEARVVRKIADWLERTTEPNDPCDGHCIAAAIRANAWRS